MKKSPKLNCMIPKCPEPANHHITNKQGETGHFCQTHCLDAIRYITAKGVK